MTHIEVVEIVNNGEFIIDDPNSLRSANKYGWTVAHSQAGKGWTIEDPEILKLADNNGWTVAHRQAWHGWTTNDPEILILANTAGHTVADVIKKD